MRFFRFEVCSKLIVALLGVTTLTHCAIGFPEGRKQVTDVDIEGGEDLDEGDIVDGLANHSPRGIIFRTYAAYDELALEVDRRRIASYYESHGYFSVRVEEANVTIDDEKSDRPKVTVQFNVEEGEPSFLREVHFVTTSTTVDEEFLSSWSTLVVDKRFDHDAYTATKDAILREFQYRGRPRASVTGRIAVDRDRHEVRIELEVDPGPLVHFDKVVLEPGAIPESAIRARLAWEPGDQYDPNKLKTTEGRLYALDLVGSVRFTPTYHDGDTKLDLSVGISETSNNELKLGGGFKFDSAGYSVHGRAAYTRRNFFHPLMSLRLNLQPEVSLLSNGRPLGVRIRASADVQRDDFLYPRLTMTTGVAYRLVTFEAFTTQGPSMGIVFARPFLDDRLKLSVAFNAALYEIIITHEDVVPESIWDTYGIAKILPLLYAVPSASYDGRDDPLSPHRGYYASLPFEIGKLFRSDGAFYMKATPELQGYLPIFTTRIVLAGRVRVGANVLDKPLPITQRYFAGGSDSERGFGRRRLSPGVVDTTDKNRYLPLGAEAMFVANAELRFEIVRVFGQWLGAVGFVDVGDAANDIGDLSFDNPHLAVGSGLRYHTPVGPLRLDVGYRANRFGAGEPDTIAGTKIFDRIRFHISIGEAF